MAGHQHHLPGGEEALHALQGVRGQTMDNLIPEGELIVHHTVIRPVQEWDQLGSVERRQAFLQEAISDALDASLSVPSRD